MSGPSGHPAFPCALITQPLLPGFQAKRPDFLWLAADSLNTYAVLLEIEAPTKRMFTKVGTPTAEFNQAQNQLATWKSWLSTPANETTFRQNYLKDFDYPWRRFVAQYVLIYGRQAELEARPELNLTRAQMPRESEFFMTFDRLHPINDHDQYMTANAMASGIRQLQCPQRYSLVPRTRPISLRFRGRRKWWTSPPSCRMKGRRFSNSASYIGTRGQSEVQRKCSASEIGSKHTKGGRYLVDRRRRKVF